MNCLAEAKRFTTRIWRFNSFVVRNELAVSKNGMPATVPVRKVRPMAAERVGRISRLANTEINEKVPK